MVFSTVRGCLFMGLAQFYFRLYYPLVNYCQILQENIRKTTLSLSFSSLPFLGSGLELVIGWFLDLFWNLRYWDYSGYFLDFRGYICLVSALGFGIAGVLWVCIFSKILQKWWYHISLIFEKNGICFGFSFLLLTAPPHLFFQIPDIVFYLFFRIILLLRPLSIPLLLS